MVRGYREMRSKVTLVARNLERAEKIGLQREIKDAIGSVGVAEVGALYKDDAALADNPARLRDRPGRSLQKGPCQVVLRWRHRVHRRHGPAASRGLARMLRFHRHYPPVARVAN